MSLCSVASGLHVTVQCGLWPACHCVVWPLACMSLCSVASGLHVTVQCGLWPACHCAVWPLACMSLCSAASGLHVTVQCGLWPACHCAVFLSSLLRRCVSCAAGGDPGGGGIRLHQRLLDGREFLSSEPVPQCQCCLTHLCCALHCSQGYNRQKTYIAAQGEWK